MIELYLWEQLAEVAQCGTLSAASQKLHLSQPALSRSMKKIEEVIGVSLFERYKNKLILNETGKMAAQYAVKLLAQEQDIRERIQMLDRSRHTISFGSCAPVPVGDFVPVLMRIYEGMTITSEVKNDDELIEGLKKDRYQIVILHEEPTDEMLYYKECGQERICLSLPPGHPLTAYSELSFADIDGQNLLLYTYIGFWYHLCRKRMPRAHFLMMNEYDAFGEAVGISSFPAFASDILIERNGMPDNRIIVPITDEDAGTSYYCVCKRDNREKYAEFFRWIEEQN